MTIYTTVLGAGLELHGIRFCSPSHTATSHDVIVMHEDQRHWDNGNVMHLYRDIISTVPLAGAAGKVKI